MASYCQDNKMMVDQPQRAEGPTQPDLGLDWDRPVDQWEVPTIPIGSSGLPSLGGLN